MCRYSQFKESCNWQLFSSVLWSLISFEPLQASKEKIEQLENDLNLSEKVWFTCSLVNCIIFLLYNFSFLQQVDRFRELYLTEQEQKLDVESELKDCKVKKFLFFFSSLLSFLGAYISSEIISSEIIFFQVNLENSNKTLLDLQESYRLAITMLKEKESIISKLQRSGKWTERSTQNFVLRAVHFFHWQTSIYLSMHKQKIL